MGWELELSRVEETKVPCFWDSAKLGDETPVIAADERVFAKATVLTVVGKIELSLFLKAGSFLKVLDLFDFLDGRGVKVFKFFDEAITFPTETLGVYGSE